MTAASPYGPVEVAGILVPSTSLPFLTAVAAHVLVALLAVGAGAAAMLLRKGTRLHHILGTIYYWALTATVALGLILSAVRWHEDYPLAILGTLAFATATVGRLARRRSWPAWTRFHVGGMGASYMLMLTAFYVDNGKNLPLWKQLPSFAYWVLPAVIGVPITLLAIRRYSPAGSPPFRR